MSAGVIRAAIVSMFQKMVAYLMAMATARGMGWLAVESSLVGWNLGAPESFKRYLNAFYVWGASMVLWATGMELDEDDPFSDGSMCAAIGKKTGMVLRTLKDRESIKKDVERWALALLEEKTGLHIRDVRNKEKVIKDVMKFASPVVADATGLPLSDISNPDTVKSEVKDYLKDRALVLLSHDIERVKVLSQEALKSVGSSLELLAKEIERKGGIDPVTGLPNVRVDATMIALGVLARALIQADKRRREEEMARQKVSRRTEQMRAALARFREKNGHRMTYERV